MGGRTAFRFTAAGLSLELRGPEEFVRRHLAEFLPLVEHVARRERSNGHPPAGPCDVRTWFERNVPDGVRLTMQDSILVFALWMRSFKKYIFTSEDVRRAFMEIGQPEPKSLLQILGTLKRDHNLILGTERRGEYMLNTTGIERARGLLGVPLPSAAPGEGASS